MPLPRNTVGSIKSETVTDTWPEFTMLEALTAVRSGRTQPRGKSNGGVHVRIVQSGRFHDN